MPVDPRHAATGDVNLTRAQQHADTNRRIDALERQPRVQAGNGPPTNDCRDGTLYVDTAQLRLYVHAGGAWCYIPLQNP